jgi:hypothetical protein
MPGEGAPSNPDVPEQPNEADRPVAGHWRGNPWYGGPSNIDESSDAKEVPKGPVDTEWPKNPRPQKQIYDRPTIPFGFFIAQLICARGEGKVHFQWQFSPGDPGFRRHVLPEWARDILRGPAIAPVFSETDPFSEDRAPNSR